MTNTILLILQLLGLLLAACAAVANFLKSKGFDEIRTPSLVIGGPDKITRRLTREARVGVCFLIGGLLVSFGAKALEQYLTSKRAAANQEATTRQLQR